MTVQPMTAAALTAKLDHLPPLVTADEIHALRTKLKDVAVGRAFFLEINDYLFDIGSFGAKEVWDSLRVLLQVNAVFMLRTGLPTVKVTGLTNDIIEGAAQAASPHSFDTYGQLAAIANLTRAFAQGGESDMRNIRRWPLKDEFSDPVRARYEALVAEIRRCLDFVQACGITGTRFSPFEKAEIFLARNVGDFDLAMVANRPAGQRFSPLGHLGWAGRYAPDPLLVDRFAGAGLDSPLVISTAPDGALEDLGRMIAAVGNRDALICLEEPPGARPEAIDDHVARLEPVIGGAPLICRVKVDATDGRAQELHRLVACYAAFFEASLARFDRLGGFSIDTAAFTTGDVPKDRLTPDETLALSFELGERLQGLMDARR